MRFCSLRESELMSIASGCNEGMLSKMIAKVEVIGTESTIPQGPQTHPQKISDTNIRSGLRFNAPPMIRGVKTEPIKICVTNTVTATAIGVPTESNCTNATDMGKMAAKIEPMLGMNVNKKVRSPQKIARSTPKSARTIDIATPDNAFNNTVVVR